MFSKSKLKRFNDISEKNLTPAPNSYTIPEAEESTTVSFAASKRFYSPRKENEDPNTASGDKENWANDTAKLNSLREENLSMKKEVRRLGNEISKSEREIKLLKMDNEHFKSEFSKKDKKLADAITEKGHLQTQMKVIEKEMKALKKRNQYCEEKVEKVEAAMSSAIETNTKSLRVDFQSEMKRKLKHVHSIYGAELNALEKTVEELVGSMSSYEKTREDYDEYISTFENDFALNSEESEICTEKIDSKSVARENVSSRRLSVSDQWGGIISQFNFLQKSVEQLKFSINDVVSEKQELTANIEELKSERDSLNIDINKYGVQTDDLKMDVLSSDAQRSKVQSELCNLIIDFDNLKFEYDSLKIDVELCQSENSDLKEEIENLKNTSSVADQNYCRAVQDNCDLNHHLAVMDEKLSNIHETFKAEIEQKEKECFDVCVQITEMSKELEQTKTKLQATEQERNALLCHNTELLSCKTKIAYEKEVESENLKGRITAVEEQKTQLEIKVSRFERSNEELQASLQLSDFEVKSLSKKNQATTLELDSVRTKCDEMAVRDNELTALAAEWMNDKNDLQSRLDSITRTNEELVRSNEVLSTHLEGKEEAANLAIKQKEELAAENALVMNAMSEISGEKMCLITKCNELEAELKSLKNKEEQVTDEVAILLEENQKLIEERNAVVKEKHKIISEKYALSDKFNHVIVEKNAIISQKDAYISEKNAEISKLGEQHRDKVENLKVSFDEIFQKKDNEIKKLTASNNELVLDYSKNFIALKEHNTKIEAVRAEALEDVSKLLEEKDAYSAQLQTNNKDINTECDEWRNKAEIHELKLQEALSKLSDIEGTAMELTKAKEADIADLELERSKLLSQNNLAVEEVERLNSLNAKLLGHSNTKQKIKYVARLKEENLELKKQLSQSKNEVTHLRRTLKRTEKDSDRLKAIAAASSPRRPATKKVKKPSTSTSNINTTTTSRQVNRKL
eukprot:Nk52_evm32s1360 gene=Nk52_evmTU32s1360